MASDEQIEANRRNAKLSSGPRTIRGKEISARNRTRHGLLSRSVVIEGESHARFIELLENFRATLNPQNFVQAALVETMTVARWRQQRLWAIEQSTINTEIINRRAEPSAESSAGRTPTQTAASAVRGIDDNTSFMERMQRYEVRLQRQFDRALDRLNQLKKLELEFSNPIL